MTTARMTYCERERCKHFFGPMGPKDIPLFVCRAFPKGIPEEILSGEVNHTESYPGDNGFRYERMGQ